MSTGRLGAPRLWLFDLDGVLVDTTPCHARAYADTWADLEIAGPPYERIAGRRTVDVVREVTRVLNPGDDLVQKWVRRKQERARECMGREDLAYADARRVVASLSQRGARLAIGTAASRLTTLAILERAGWREAFSVVVTADDVPVGKPDPGVFLEAMRLSDVRPDQTLIAEDSRSGLAAAEVSGAWFGSVRSGIAVASERCLGVFADLEALHDAVVAARR